MGWHECISARHMIKKLTGDGAPPTPSHETQVKTRRRTIRAVSHTGGNSNARTSGFGKEKIHKGQCNARHSLRAMASAASLAVSWKKRESHGKPMREES